MPSIKVICVLNMSRKHLVRSQKVGFPGVAEAIISHTSGHPTFWSWVVYYFSCSPPESTQLRGRGFAKPRRSRDFASRGGQKKK
ncbi:Protein of unknown function [Cotesia congregata]|uniref:Uncharacterized protein n=1 Tax=Cotesia congregata TaxID=51543 RepID=A0A8J2HB99_COTCN|nr:Protein of unknown function [Cotesia congregata]